MVPRIPRDDCRKKRGGMLLKGDSRNLAYFSDIAEPFRSYNERKLRLINVKTNNAKVADGGD